MAATDSKSAAVVEDFDAHTRPMFRSAAVMDELRDISAHEVPAVEMPNSESIFLPRHFPALQEPALNDMGSDNPTSPVPEPASETSESGVAQVPEELDQWATQVRSALLIPVLYLNIDRYNLGLRTRSRLLTPTRRRFKISV